MLRRMAAVPTSATDPAASNGDRVLIDTFDDPLAMFQHYFQQAQATEPFDPTALALATADAEGRPAVRMVLLKGVEAGCFVFYTNYGSRKAGDLAQNPHAAMCFHWPKLGLQVRIEGDVTRGDPDSADAYFQTRPRGSQLSAWTSKQSAPLTSRDQLLAAYRDVEARHANGPVPRPDFWGGYRLQPTRIEFWASQPSRLHDRLLFTAQPGGWTRTRLYP